LYDYLIVSTIGKPSTGSLCNELTSVSDWRKLGFNLGVQDYELEQIEQSHSTEGCGRWKQETFSLWLKRTPSASWRDVVKALRKMGENTEAKKIEQNYIGELTSKLYTIQLLG